MTTNLGSLGDAIYAKAAEISEAEARVKELQTERKDLEDQLLVAMKAAGTDIVRGATATVSISSRTRASIADFSEFDRFVLRKKALHLFERRIAQTAYRELKDALNGKAVPGVSEFTYDTLNVRKV